MSTETKLKIPKWGPKKLRAIFEKIEAAVNATTPKAGFGIEITEEENGIYISLTDEAATSAGLTGEGGGGGASVDLYGARNGAAAVFHLLQSGAPTAP